MKDDAFSVLRATSELEMKSQGFPESAQIATLCRLPAREVEDILEELESSGHVKLYGDLQSQAASVTAQGRRHLKLMETRPTPEAEVSIVDKRKVFVVYGRNEAARIAMFAYLRAIGLHPLEWSEIVRETNTPSPYIGEVLKKGFSIVQAVVIVFTPDDDACLKAEYRTDHDEPYESHLTGQPRQNVLFEAGMALGLHENRTVIVEIGKLRPISDLGGRHVVRMNNSAKMRKELANRLEMTGCAVNLRGGDWLSPNGAGDFDTCLSDVAETTIDRDGTGDPDRLDCLFQVLELSNEIEDFSDRQFLGNSWRRITEETARKVRSLITHGIISDSQSIAFAKSLAGLCDRISLELRSETNITGRTIHGMLPELSDALRTVRSCLESGLDFSGSFGKHLSDSLLTSARECAMLAETIVDEQYLFANSDEIQSEASKIGSTASQLLSLPIALPISANLNVASKAARDLRLVSEIDLQVIDGGVRTQRMAEIIRDSAAAIGKQLLLK